MEYVASSPCIITPLLMSSAPTVILNTSALFMKALWNSWVVIPVSSIETAIAARAETAPSLTNPPFPSCGVPYVVIATVLPPCEVTILEPDIRILPVATFTVFGAANVGNILLSRFSKNPPVFSSFFSAAKLTEYVASLPCIMMPVLRSVSPNLGSSPSAALMNSWWNSKVLIALSSMDTAFATRAATAPSSTNPPFSPFGVPYVVTATVLPPCEVTILEPDTRTLPVDTFSVFGISAPNKFVIHPPVFSSFFSSAKLIEYVASLPCIMTPVLARATPSLPVAPSTAVMKAS